jgi:hypothetical protein
MNVKPSASTLLEKGVDLKRQITLIELVLRKLNFGYQNAKLLEILDLVSNQSGGLSLQNKALLLYGNEFGLYSLDHAFNFKASKSFPIEGKSFKSKGSNQGIVSYDSSELISLILARLLITFNSTHANDHFVWIFQKLKTGDQTASYQFWILTILLKSLSDNLCWDFLQTEDLQKEKLIDEYLVIPLLSFFNSMKSSDNVEMIVSIFDIIVEKFPELFKTHFRSLIDILVGWSIDPTISEPLRRALCAKISSYQVGWSSNLDYAVNFTNNLVYDIEQYFDISLDPQIDPTEHKVQINSLLDRSTEVDCIGQTIVAILTGIITTAFSLEISPQIHFFQSFEFSIQWYLKVMSLIALSHKFETWFSLGILLIYVKLILYSIRFALNIV